MSRADRVKEVLENEEFQAAFDKIEKDILNEMRRVDRTLIDEHQALVISLQILGRITNQFALLLSNNDEKIADFNVQQRKKKTGNG